MASILKDGLVPDRHGGAAPAQGSRKLPEHENVRGADYYR